MTSKLAVNEYVHDDIDNQIIDESNHDAANTTTNTSASVENDNESEIDDVDDEYEDESLDRNGQNNDTYEKQVEQTSSIYQANSLAAAQMLHLMNSASPGTTAVSSNCVNNNEISIQNTNGVDHEKENIPICKYCNKIFANFSNLNHHISAIHLNQSKWVCSQCGKVCSSKSNLKVHLRVHLRVKPYHCRWCSYSCMHHSSIRDHLAKVHPEKTHTPLQPGYIFNSQAVPEPDVFNSKSFNITSFVNDSQLKRANDKPQNDRTPDKIKKSRLNSNNDFCGKKSFKSENVEQQNQHMNVSNVQNSNMMQSQLQQNLMNSSLVSPTGNRNSQSSMSNIYNAYTMARMLPFMYPMQLQYAAAAAAAANQQQQQAPSQANLFNLMQFSTNANPYASSNYNAQLNQHRMMYNSKSTNPSNSFEDQTTSSNASYSHSNSHSSRSSSLSPSEKATSEMVSLVSKQIKSLATTMDEKLIKTETTIHIPIKQECSSSMSSHSPSSPCLQSPNGIANHETIETQTEVQTSIETSNTKFLYATSSPTMASSPKHHTLTVDQILSNKSNKTTQTEPTCLKCPYCNNKAF